MKILLISPYISDFYSSPRRMSYLGLISLKDVFEASHEVKILDLYSPKGKMRPLPDELSYLKPYLENSPGPSSFFSTYKTFSRSKKLLTDCLNEFKPDIAGISAFSVCYYRDIAEIADSIKAYNSRMPVVVGGTGATAFPGAFSRIPSIDLVIKGNDAESILKIMENIHSHTDIKVIDAGFSKKWDAVSNHGYSRYPLSFVMTRGCPNRCSFCSVYDVSGKKFIKSDIGKFESILRKIGQERIWINFEDDNISCDRDYFDALIAIIIKERERKDISLTFMNGIDYSTLDEKSILSLKKAGIRYLNLTLASVSSVSKTRLNRFQDKEQYEKIMAFAKGHCIDVITYFICGIPGNDPSTDFETLEYLKRGESLIGISPFYPVSENRIPEGFENMDPVLFRGSAMIPYNKGLTTQELVELFKAVRIINNKRIKWDSKAL